MFSTGQSRVYKYFLIFTLLLPIILRKKIMFTKTEAAFCVTTLFVQFVGNADTLFGHKYRYDPIFGAKFLICYVTGPFYPLTLLLLILFQIFPRRNCETRRVSAAMKKHFLVGICVSTFFSNTRLRTWDADTYKQAVRKAKGRSRLRTKHFPFNINACWHVFFDLKEKNKIKKYETYEHGSEFR